MIIRILDFTFAFLGLVLLAPVFCVIYLCVFFGSKGAGFYKQSRVGKNGVDFYLYKFRTMRVGSDKKSLITIGGRDSRITAIGYFLRKYKLDELPQLINVLQGDMSIVGPRPEVRKYVDLYTQSQKQVLSIRPGITDYASIEYVDENILLGKSENPEQTYISVVMPDKIKYNMKYINKQSVSEYFRIIILTIMKLFR